MSSDWTSGMPALSSVASSWLKIEELAGGDPPPARQPERQPGQAARALQREDEQALLLELAAQPGLALGDVDAFDDLAAWRAEPTAEFHRHSSA